MPVSPGIYIREFDFSTYARRLGRTALALIGGASKGPLNTPVRVSNEADLVRTFGKPLLDDYGLQAAIQYLKKADNLLFVRVAHGALQASYPLPGASAGTAATKATGTISLAGGVNPADGDTVTIASSVPTLALENDANGAIGNTAITATGGFGASGAFAGGSATTRATATFRMVAQPVDGDTLALNDGTTLVTFEFDDGGGVVGGNVGVTIGADVFATAANLQAAIAAHAFAISATDVTVKKTFEFDSNASYGAGNHGVLIGTTASDTLSNLMSAIALYRDTLKVSVRNTTTTVPQATLTNDVAGAFGNAPVLKTGAIVLVAGFTGGTDAVPGVVSTVMNAYALNPGTWGNSIQVAVQQTATIGAPAANFDLFVYAPVDDGSSMSLVERFYNLSLSPTSDRYVEEILAHGKRGEVDASEYLEVDVVAGAGTITPSAVDPLTGALIPYQLGQAPGVAGTDGISGLTSSDYIGTVAGQTATGLQALRNPEVVEYNLLAVPGVTSKDVINAVLRLADQRGDFFYLIDAPFGLSRDQVIDWHNGTLLSVPDAPVTPINSSYAGLFWSWVEAEDAYSKKTLWLPPSGFVAAAMAASDEVNGPWYAVAGHVRGLVDTGLAVEYSPTLEDRDLLVGVQNRVNPIVNFANGGLTIYGNRTTQRKATALDSIHVRRMLLHAEKVCATAVRVLTFDPNDPVTWDKFTSLCNRELSAIKAGRGIEEFEVICDASTNPPSQRANKTMRGKLLVRPVDAAEIIQLDFAIFANGAEFNYNF